MATAVVPAVNLVILESSSGHLAGMVLMPFDSRGGIS